MLGSPYSIVNQVWYREWLFAWSIPQRVLEFAREKLIPKLFGPSVKKILTTVNS